MSAYEKLDEQKQFACRVIADHARATAFSIADGILPGNEGRNYVLRKIMRRAIYQGRHVLLAHAAWHEGLFFNKAVNFVIDQMGEAYPELEAQREFIVRMVKLEEERFATTLTVGLQKLDQFHANRRASKALFENPEQYENLTDKDWTELARLYDTFGTPRDLIRVSLEERGVQISEEEFLENFDAALQEIQQTSSVGKTEQKTKTKPLYADVASRVQSLFRGYETTRVDDGKVLSIIRDDAEVSELKEGDDGGVVLDQTPFYAESGGQVGDVGTIVAGGTGVSPVNPAQDARATIARVADTYSPVQGLVIHKVRIEKGSIKVGDTVTAEVDVETRDATRRNHTATHLVHAALREVLGP